MEGAFPWALAAGVLAGLVWLLLAASPAPAELAPRARRLDAALAALALGVASARLGFVLLHPAYFLADPARALYLWEGGLTWPGAALGALLGVALTAWLQRISFWRLADSLAVPAAWASAGGWLGCYLEACAFGRAAAAGWWAPPAPDLLGQVAPRWPTQSLGVVGSLLVSLILLSLRRRLPSGARACLAGALLGGLTLGLSLLRGDPSPTVAGLRVEGLGAALFAAMGLLGLAYRLAPFRGRSHEPVHHRPRPDQHPPG